MKYIIAIDSGHGSDTKGKQSPDGSLREWEFNKDIEKRLVALCQEQQINYFVVHLEDTDVPLSKRKLGIKRFLEVNKDVTLVGVSIHADAFENEKANGFTLFYKAKNGDKNGSLASFRLASIIESTLIESYNKTGISIKSRGVKASPIPDEIPSYFVLREYPGTWTLIEAGFMTNIKDCDYLKSEYFRNTFAKSVFEGIKRYCQI